MPGYFFLSPPSVPFPHSLLEAVRPPSVRPAAIHHFSSSSSSDQPTAGGQRTAVISDAGCSSVYFSSEAKQQVDPFFFACGTQRGLRRHTSHYPGFFAQSSIATVSARLSVADLFF